MTKYLHHFVIEQMTIALRVAIVFQALEWLKEEAAKEGWAKATKLQNRPMSQGVIGVIARPNSALLLEVG